MRATRRGGDAICDTRRSAKDKVILTAGLGKSVAARGGRHSAPVEIVDLDASVEPEFVWSDCFGESSNGSPSIGLIPGMRACFAALGYGGDGNAFGAVAAQLIRRSIVGLPDPDADLFAFA